MNENTQPHDENPADGRSASNGGLGKFPQERLHRMRECAPLLPEPGGEVVCECLDEIERLIEDNKRLRKIAAYIPADIYIKAKEISWCATRIIPNVKLTG